jgi:4-hydroxy-2-oxoheptanedioate aldolase
MINTPEDAIATLQSCRYIQPRGAPDQKPVGRRGHGPGACLRYWGVGQPEYYDKADVWPLDPNGEILPLLQCQTIESVENLPRIIDAVDGKPGAILISESDLSVSLGLRDAYTSEVADAVQRAAKTRRDRGVPFGTRRRASATSRSASRTASSS